MKLKEVKVLEVYYNADPRFDLFVLKLSDGKRHLIGREKLKGLQGATKRQIAEVQIVGSGTGLHWPKLDLDFYVPDLLRGIYRTEQWMSEIGRRGGSSKSRAKAKAAKTNGLKGGRPKKMMFA
jgi:hypothetical protein